MIAVTSQTQRLNELRAQGALGIVANLDHPEQLYRLRGLADTVVHLAPPPAEGSIDQRTRHLLRILPRGGRLVYVSTTGVYGDCAGAQASLDALQAANPNFSSADAHLVYARALEGAYRRPVTERWLHFIAPCTTVPLPAGG